MLDIQDNLLYLSYQLQKIMGVSIELYLISCQILYLIDYQTLRA
jgi:hypothetical protein